MPTIRVDAQVMDELKKRATTMGLVFKPPNSTLRKVLGLDGDVKNVAKEGFSDPKRS